MKIAFDASDLCTDRADGTTRYTREILTRLVQQTPSDSWEILAPCEKPASLNVFSPTCTWNASPWPMYWTQSRMALDLFKKRPDMLFMPIQQLPIVRPPRLTTISVVHDLAVHKYPEQFTYKDWLLLHVFTAQVAREADHIIAISQTTADDLATYYGRTKNVHVIHHGVNHKQFYVPSEDEKAKGLTDIQKKYPNLTKPYILYIGQIQPRKNLIRLIEAFEVVNKDQPDLQLVIGGAHGWLQQPIIDRVESSQVKDKIHMVGRVPDELLAPLYWHADAFVLPSLYEGFGMPVLEAMASGCPVVTSNTSSLPEVAEDAAVLVDPLDTDSVANGIRTAQKKRDELIAKGIAQAKGFTWEKTATETLAVLEAAKR